MAGTHLRPVRRARLRGAPGDRCGGVLHHEHGGDKVHGRWTLELASGALTVETERRGPGAFHAVLPDMHARFHGEPSAISRAQVASWFSLLDRDLDVVLAELGAEYAYLLDAEAGEGRHWNYDGVVEDAATGSAAGCVAAYLHRHGLLGDDQDTELRQGRFINRPSLISISARSADGGISVRVGGEVVLVGSGRLDVLPS